jgi:hypothetical protein
MLNVVNSNLSTWGGLWMKLHEKCEYLIDVALRFSLIQIHLDLKSGLDFTSKPRVNWDGCGLTNQIDNMKILIKFK